MTVPAIDQLWAEVVTDSQGLVPCVAQDVRTRAVLMVAWVSKDALARALETGYAVYYSRSRQTLWEKGAVSGKRQRLVHVRLDNDRDTLLYLVDAKLPAGNDGSDTYFNYRRQGAAWVWDPITLSSPPSEADADDATELLRTPDPDLGLRTHAARLLDARDAPSALRFATDLVETLVRTLKGRGLSLRAVLRNLERRINAPSAQD